MYPSHILGPAPQAELFLGIFHDIDGKNSRYPSRMLGCEIRVCPAFTLHTVTSGEVISLGIAHSNDPDAVRLQNLGRQWLRTVQAGTDDDLWNFNEKNEPMAPALIQPNTLSSIPSSE